MLHGVIGRREVGKTTLTLYLARQDAKVPRLIFDQRNDIAARGVGAVKVYSADELIDAYGAVVARQCSEIVYAPLDGTIDGFTSFSTVVHHYISTYKGRRLAVLLDEAGVVEHELANLDHPFQLAMRFCRRPRVHFYLTCHQPKNLPTNTRAITDYLIFFRCSQEHDLDAIRKRTSEAFAAAVARLDPYRFLIWNDKLGQPMPCSARPEHWKVTLGEPDEEETVTPAPTVDLGSLWRI